LSVPEPNGLDEGVKVFSVLGAAVVVLDVVLDVVLVLEVDVVDVEVVEVEEVDVVEVAVASSSCTHCRSQSASFKVWLNSPLPTSTQFSIHLAISFGRLS
jgi:hypothetical protein